ncbi:MAG: hypothetical protein RIC36_05225 [Rhodospirillales bacterium]
MKPRDFRFTRTYRRLVEGKNINRTSLLATDYLNHFNEVVMLLEMAPDMPEILEDARDWQPRTYCEHFNESTFSDRQLAVWAYENAPKVVIGPFEQLVDRVNGAIVQAIEDIGAASATLPPEHLRLLVNDRLALIKRLLEKIASIINGARPPNTQAEIDALINAADGSGI